MSINKNKLTKEMIMAAMQCETAEELMALAKSGGYEITKEEAEAYLEDLSDVELDDKQLQRVAGGLCYTVTMVCYTIKNTEPGDALATCNDNK